MARFAFTWELGQGLGHLVRYLPLVRTLVERDDDVWFLVKNVGQAERVFSGLPVRIEQIEPGITPRALQLKTLNSYPEILRNFGFYSGALEKQVAAWIGMFGQIDPDLLVIDHSPMAMLANRISKIPSIVSGTGFTVPPSTTPMRPLRYWELPARDNLLRIEREVLRSANSALRRFDAPPLQTLSQLFDCDVIWLLSFPELDHYGERVQASYYGNFAVPGHGEQPTWKDLDAPKVFAYLSSAQLPTEFVAAITELNVNLCLFAPNIEAVPKGFDDSLVFHSHEPIDLVVAAAECDVAVTNGGLNTVSSFFQAGIRQLVIANNLERYMVGRRLEQAVPEYSFNIFDWDGEQQTQDNFG